MAALPHPFRGAAHRADLGPARDGAPAPFPLLRWFALLSGAAVLLAAVSGAHFLDRTVERASLLQSADGLTQLVSGLAEVEGAERLFAPDRRVTPDEVGEFLAHLASLPGVLRANVYGADRTVLWSTDPALIGKRFPANDELDAALAGVAVASSGRVGRPPGKAEHARLASPGDRYVENYLPVWSAARDGEPRRVIGAVEFYRRPVGLLEGIRRTQERVWWGALAVAALLYLALFVIVARAAAVMARQQRALVAAERLAIAGEMASAVAHGLRNPLASIRSTAELGLETGASGSNVGALLAEIVAQADRLEGWIRQFLTSARSDRAAPAAAEVAAALEECAAGFRPALARRGMELALEVPSGLPPVRCHPVVLRQVLNSVLANAIEAMEAGGGRIAVRARHRPRRRRAILVEVKDTGPGMSAAQVAAALEPFATSKPAGLGLGLPLAREALERQGGRLAIESQPGAGTTVRLLLPAVAGTGEAGG
jgi:signal transduction histidine kinase